MRYYYTFSVTTPPGILPAAAQQTPWPLVDGTLRSIEVVIPSGHSGLTGLAATSQGTQVLPWGASGWIIGDNVTIPVELDYDVAASGLVLNTYNTGFYAHTHYLRAAVDTLAPRSGLVVPSFEPLSIPAQLQSA